MNQTLFGPVALIALLCLGCGTKSKEDQIQQASAEQLGTSKQTSCNGQGKFYDNLSKGEDCSAEYTLASWPCTRQGLSDHLAETKTSNAILTKLDDLKNTGYVLHQCGVSNTQIALIVVKQQLDDQSASTTIQRFLVMYPSLRFAFGEVEGKSGETKLKVGDCQEVKLSTYDLVVGGVKPVRSELAVKLSAKLDTTYFSSTDSSAKLEFYADKACSSKSDEVKFAKGADHTAFFVKGTTTGNAGFRLGAAAQDVSAPGYYYVTISAK